MKMSSARVSRSVPLPSPLKKKELEAAKSMEKQGIVSILGSDPQLNKAASLRRTLSADMSSKKWLADNGFFFSPMKRIASSEELAVPDLSEEGVGERGEGQVHDDGDDNMPSQDDVWRSIQSREGENKVVEDKPRTPLNVWSSILDEKTSNQSSNLPPPYVPPAVKRSSSTLSEKSLEICTESLGSETGSEGFSSYHPSETGDAPEEEDRNNDAPEQQQQHQEEPFEELQVAKYNYNPSKRSPPRDFPPPLPSLARGNGASLQMHSSRKNGRLVLEAVSVPENNYFRAERQQGRLLLSLVKSPTSEEPRDEIEEDRGGLFSEVFDNIEDVKENETAGEEEKYGLKEEVEEEEEEEYYVEKPIGAKEMAIVVEQSSSLPSGMMKMHRSALMMNRLVRMDNIDPTWSHKLTKAVNLMDAEDAVEGLTPPSPIPQSLPPASRVACLIASSPPPPTSTTTFNAYEYFWRSKPTMSSIIDPIYQQCPPLKGNNFKPYEKQDLVVMRGNKGGYLVPYLRSCKDSRRSLLIWQPHCVATS